METAGFSRRFITKVDDFSNLARTISPIRLKFVDFIRIVHTFVPFFLIVIHYGFILNYENKEDLPSPFAFTVYYCIMCGFAFLGSMVYYFPGTHKLTLFNIFWTTCRASLCLCEFIAVTYARAKPFKHYWDYSYTGASYFFWITNTTILIFAILIAMYPERLASSPVDLAMIRLHAEYDRVATEHEMSSDQEMNEVCGQIPIVLKK